jgi:hypothetical protein
MIFFGALLVFAGWYFASSIPLFTSSVTISASCQGECSDIYVQVNSDSAIGVISVSLFQAPSVCFNGHALCDVLPVYCKPPAGFCININSLNNFANVTFKGVEQGYYLLTLGYNFSNGTGISTGAGLFVTGHITYFATANLTLGLGTLPIEISNSTQ